MERIAYLLLGGTLLLYLGLDHIGAAPMLYRRNPDEKYEADLIPVSSTVIPLTVLEVSYGLGGKPSDAYKAAYLRKLRMQVQQRADAAANGVVFSGEASELQPASSDADALITVKSKQLEAAMVKAI